MVTQSTSAGNAARRSASDVAMTANLGTYVQSATLPASQRVRSTELDEGAGSNRMFPKDVAKGITDAVNLAITRYRVENDPRKGLKL